MDRDYLEVNLKFAAIEFQVSLLRTSITCIHTCSLLTLLLGYC